MVEGHALLSCSMVMYSSNGPRSCCKVMSQVDVLRSCSELQEMACHDTESGILNIN